MPFCYEYECPNCKKIWEETRQLQDRNRPGICPRCECKEGRKIMSATHFNPIFPGSTRQEHLADYWTQESIRAQEEGFRSKGELETAIGMAKERAAKMGDPDKQLVGPVESPFKGEKYVPTQEEAVVADALVKRNLKAAQEGDERKMRSARAALKEHETMIKEKAQKKTQDFVPKHTKDQLKKRIKQAQEARKA